MNAATQTHWYDPLRATRSLGSTAERPGSLAGLAQARKHTLSQFFTAKPVADFMWALAAPAMDRAIARAPGARVSIFDNSIGNGRLIERATPTQHVIGGVDVHHKSIIGLGRALEGAGFSSMLHCCSMGHARAEGFSVALINPPFSLTLSTPALEPFPCTTFGRHGPNSSALSHRYALEQALSAADVVIALLPRTQAYELIGQKQSRLRAVFHLSDDAFAEEGIKVSTSILAFGREQVASYSEQAMATAAPAPDLGLDCCNTIDRDPAIHIVGLDDARPSIHTPVTGDSQVRVVHDGRRIGLRFACGSVEASVRNAVLRRPVRAPSDTHRYPKGVRFVGQGLLDLELHLAQSDPSASFEDLLATIRAAGGTPCVDRGLAGYLARRIKTDARARCPYRHVVKGDGLFDGATFEATARTVARVDPTRWVGPVFRKDARYPVTVNAGQFQVTHSPGHTRTFEHDAFTSAFESHAETTTGWRVVHAGRVAAFPALASEFALRMRREGLDRFLTFGYQFEDVQELLIGGNAYCAAAMGLGKSRLGIALALMGGTHNLIAVEPQLVSELVRELHAIGIPQDQWQVITTAAQCRDLRRINIVSHVRLRLPICEGAGRRTLASLLRKKIHTAIVDEAQILRHHESAQSRALWMLSPKRRICLSGTPVCNYTRDVLSQMIWTHGDGTAVQPFGMHRPVADAALIRSMDLATTGAARFIDRFSVFEWVTFEFEHSGLVRGAKREVPKTRNVDALRQWIAPLIKRRVADEPDVAKHFAWPAFEVVHHDIDFDDPHLAFTLKLADEFAHWFKRQRELQQETGKSLNLVALLARIGALERAVTFPQFSSDFGSYLPITSKQRAILDRTVELSEAGHKIIVYVPNPGMSDMLVSQLRARGVDAIPFHGQMDITTRTDLMNRRFRFGDCPVMVATLGVTQTGLNLHCADRALFASYGWSHTVLRQAMARLLRPQQLRKVVFEFFGLTGSLDEYQKRMTSLKGDSADTVLDFLEPEHAHLEFIHLERIMAEFVADLAERRGTNPIDLRRELTAHA